jgi:hypothetical protein
MEGRNILRTIKRSKTNWIGHILPRDCLLKHAIEGKIEVTGRQGRRRKQLLNGLKEKRGLLERGSTRSHSLQNSLWNKLWICRKTDCGVNEWWVTGYWVCRAPADKRSVTDTAWTHAGCSCWHVSRWACEQVGSDKDDTVWEYIWTEGLDSSWLEARMSLRRTAVTGNRLLWNNAYPTHFYSTADNFLRRTGSWYYVRSCYGVSTGVIRHALLSLL